MPIIKYIMSVINKKSLLISGNIITLAIALAVNMLANILPINGRTTGEISDSIPNLFAPAGYVFAIWGLIYVLLIVFAVYQVLPKNRDNAFLEKIGLAFITGNLANSSWIFLWHYDQVVLSLVAMLVLFATLLYIYLKLDIGRQEIPQEEKLAVHLLFSVYLGWITVATVANVTAVLVTLNWDGFGINDIIWTSIILITVLIITLLMISTRKDYAYSFVIIWAVVGIAVKQWTAVPEVALVALLVAILVGASLVAIKLNVRERFLKRVN
ncbi:MAG: TspO/MBR family protein [Candidatus Odinarchaeota archaeon]